jgi:hypothetical protein
MLVECSSLDLLLPRFVIVWELLLVNTACALVLADADESNDSNKNTGEDI